LRGTHPPERVGAKFFQDLGGTNHPDFRDTHAPLGKKGGTMPPKYVVHILQ